MCIDARNLKVAENELGKRRITVYEKKLLAYIRPAKCAHIGIKKLFKVACLGTSFKVEKLKKDYQ